MTFFICLLSVSFLAAQTVTGELKDSDGEPLIGASVVVQGTNSGTITDIDGRYSIQASPGDVLLISYIGYRDQTVTVGDDSNISLVMDSDSEILDEVVVVGYGTRKKSHNTGSIASIGGAEIAAIQATRVDDALAGKLSGVNIQNIDGEPGADPKIQIRGASSVTSNTDPLIVVDGFPISGSLATINPNDIQSLEVLKDAASAAVYGSRGANGVVLVTTKQGTPGKPQISYDAYVSTSQRYRSDVDQLKTASEWADIVESGVASGRFNPDYEEVASRLGLEGEEIGRQIFDYRNRARRNAPDVVAVEDYLFQDGNANAQNLSFKGGSDDAKYFASVGYQDTEGVVRTQNFERVNARLNLDANIGKRFKTGLNVNGFYGNRDIVGTDMRDLLRAYSVHPIYHTAASIDFVQELNDEAVALGLDPFDAGFRGGDAPFNNSIQTLEPGMTAQDWHYGRSNNGIGGSGDAGPATKLDNVDRFEKTLYANANAYLQFEILEGLNIRTALGADFQDRQRFFSQGLEFDSRARTTQTSLDDSNILNQSVLSETTLNYNKVLNGVHDIGVVAGIEFQSFFNRGNSLQATNIPFGLPFNFAFVDPADITTTEISETFTRRSQFGRINYAYDNRYLASVSARRDGDSRFGENNRFKTFPAVSVGWNVHNENFFNSSFLTGLKLRASYGELGTTSGLGAYDALALLNPAATIFGNGFLIPSNVANPDLTWQTNKETNFGVSLGFLENRFTLGVDYFISDIEDILIDQSVSEVNGTDAVILNAGDVESSGIELELGANIINNRDLRWSVSANFSSINTEITDLNGLDELPRERYGQSGRAPVFRNYVGGEIGEMWGLETAGIIGDEFISDPSRTIGVSSGEYFVVDQNGDGVIDNTRTVEEGGDLVKIGQNTPDFYYGFSTNVSYKDFDLSMQWQGTSGAEVFNVDQIYWRSEFGGRLRNDFDADGDQVVDAGTINVAGEDIGGRNFITSNSNLDAQIQNASYLALRNLTIGYTVKGDWMDTIGLSGLRVYAASTNLFYLFADGYTSLNPEGIEITNGGYRGPITNGVQVGASPVVRSFTFGLNVNF